MCDWMPFRMATRALRVSPVSSTSFPIKSYFTLEFAVIVSLFAAELDTNTNVAVYVKLPDGFYIATPVGHYNPDWAIAFYEGSVKHIYLNETGSIYAADIEDLQKRLDEIWELSRQSLASPV